MFYVHTFDNENFKWVFIITVIKISLNIDKI